MSKNMRGPNGGVLLYRKEHQRQIARALFPDTQGGANENTMFAKVVALDVLRQIDIKAYATQMIRSARRMAVAFERRGLSVVTGGTDSHIVLVDLRSHGVTGEEVELRCLRHGVLLNRNLVPRDTLGPQITSGVRAGTACVTILGYAETDLDLLGNWIADRAVGIVDDQATELVAYLTQRYNTGLFPNNALPGSV
jgi:glycine hydroxymethyltransferase